MRAPKETIDKANAYAKLLGFSMQHQPSLARLRAFIKLRTEQLTEYLREHLDLPTASATMTSMAVVRHNGEKKFAYSVVVTDPVLKRLKPFTKYQAETDELVTYVSVCLAKDNPGSRPFKRRGHNDKEPKLRIVPSQFLTRLGHTLLH